MFEVRRFRGAPQKRLDPREQLLAAERLHDVVVGAGPETAHLVDLATPRGEQDHRHVAQVAQALERLEAVELGHREIEDDDVRRILVEDPKRQPAVLGCFDGVASPSEELLEQQTDVVVVVHDEHPPRGPRRHRVQYEPRSGR